MQQNQQQNAATRSAPPATCELYLNKVDVPPEQGKVYKGVVSREEDQVVLQRVEDGGKPLRLVEAAHLFSQRDR